MKLTKEALDDLEQRLQELHHSIKEVQAAGAPAGASRQLDQSSFTALLDQLREEIADSNPGTAELQALLESLDVFDFAGAAQHLEAARMALN